jgi:hypothetical protein
MSRRPALESKTSILEVSLYVGLLAAVFAGTASYVYGAFRPQQLPNLGLAAYHPPSAVELLPPPRTYLTLAPAVEASVAEASPFRTPEASSRSASADNTPAEGRPNKKTAHRSRARDPGTANVANSAPWGTPWQNQWPTGANAQAHAQWPPQGRDPRVQSSPQDNRSRGQRSNQPALTFAQYGFQRSW